MAVIAAASACASVAPASAASFGSRTLERGDRGQDVRTMQHLLTRTGYATPATGYFGTMSQRSVKRFERRFGQRRDGRLTPREARALDRAAAAAAPGRSTSLTSLTSLTSVSTVATDSARTASVAPPTGGAAPLALAPPTGKARLLPDGTAIAPADAPPVVQAVIEAGNKIAFKPYRYGGGHGRFPVDTGYDCSGSVSYALHGGGLLRSPLPSSGFYSYGRSGRGRWITLYANGGHMYMVVAGLRYDTSGARQDGSRWHAAMRSGSGYQVRHPAGL